jgi:hypothetical protein
MNEPPPGTGQARRLGGSSAFALTILLLAGRGGMLSAQALVGDRPTFTPSPLVVPKGRLQVEAGYTVADVSDADVHSLGEVLLRFGLTEPVELRAGWLGYAWIDAAGGTTISGANDGSIGIKWTVARAGPGGGPDLAILLGTSVPVGDSTISSGDWEPGASVVLGWGLTDWMSVTASIGYAYRSVARRFDQGFVSAVFSAATSPQFSLFLEGYGFNKENANGDLAFLTDAGAVYALGNDWLLDARVGIGFGDSVTGLYGGVGFVTAW